MDSFLLKLKEYGLCAKHENKEEISTLIPIIKGVRKHYKGVGKRQEMALVIDDFMEIYVQDVNLLIEKTGIELCVGYPKTFYQIVVRFVLNANETDFIVYYNENQKQNKKEIERELKTNERYYKENYPELMFKLLFPDPKIIDNLVEEIRKEIVKSSSETFKKGKLDNLYEDAFSAYEQTLEEVGELSER